MRTFSNKELFGDLQCGAQCSLALRGIFNRSVDTFTPNISCLRESEGSPLVILIPASHVKKHEFMFGKVTATNQMNLIVLIYYLANLTKVYIHCHVYRLRRGFRPIADINDSKVICFSRRFNLASLQAAASCILNSSPSSFARVL